MVLGKIVVSLMTCLAVTSTQQPEGRAETAPAQGVSEGIVLENDYVVYKIGPDGKSLSLLDKRTGKEHCAEDEIYQVVDLLYQVAPKVLKEHGKAKNPWPNVDAGSGALLYHYGLKEFPYYTVLFSVSRSMGMLSQLILNRAMGTAITRPKSVSTEWIKAQAAK